MYIELILKFGVSQSVKKKILNITVELITRYRMRRLFGLLFNDRCSLIISQEQW